MANNLFSLTLYSGVPWDENGENQVYAPQGITPLLEQYKEATFYDYSFVRRDSRNIPIRINADANKYIKCNYLQVGVPMEYQIAGGPQVLFGFIKEIQYVNDKCAFIIWTEDYFQTWVYQLEFGDCFIERASVPPETDTIGNYLLPEPIGVPMYEYDAVSQTKFNYKWHLYSSEVPPVNNSLPAGWAVQFPGNPGNEYSACFRYDSANLDGIWQLVENFTKDGSLESIVAVFSSVDIPENYEYNVNINTVNIHGIPVKNKKCFTYPYYSYVVSGPGFAKEYRTEKCDDLNNGLKFKFKTIIQPNGILIMYPENYNNNNGLMVPEDTIQFGGFRQAAYSADTFTNTIVQNLPSMVMSSIIGAMASNEMLLVRSGNNLASIWGDMLVPRTVAGNGNASSIFFADGVTITTGYKAPSREVVKNLDDYFTMYGYNVSTIRNPMYFWNNKGNRRFVYVKTRNVEIHGKIPTSALNYITNLFNNGVRFWIDPEDIGNYELRWD